jgi:multidrug efflux pump subunit AcrA (membrane-fusion protein)
MREFYVSMMHDTVTMQAEQSKQSLAQLEASLKQQKVTRQTSLDNSRIALDTATDKLDDLRKDQETMKIASGADGIVLYGSFRNKTWQPMQPEQLRAGEKVQAQQVLMTVWEPTKMKVLTDLPESKLAWVAAGSKARVSPAAMNGVTYFGSVDSIDILGASKGTEQGFETSIALEGADPRLAPGYKALVVIPGGKADDVLILPVSAVSKGRVWVKAGNKTEAKEVTTGRSDGINIEIKSGLNEGDEVLKQAKK